MGLIEEKRKKILREMEAGRGSAIILPHPVSLEPPYLPFALQARKISFFERLFNGIPEDQPVGSDDAPAIISRLSCIRIKPSREDKNCIDTTEQLLISLPSESPIAFEIIGRHGRISFQITLAEGQCSQAVSQIRSHFPGADVSIDEDLVRASLSSPSAARAYRLKASPFFILSPVADSSLDPLRSLFGILGDLEKERAGILQVLFGPVVNDWKDNMRRASRSPYDPAQSSFIDLPGLPKIVDKKISKPLFAVSLRMLASDKDLLLSMEQFLKQFENGETGLVAIPGAYPLESILARNAFVNGAILNSTELSYIVHLPAPELLDSAPAIKQAVKSYPVPEEYLSGGPVLGINVYRGIRRMVCHSARLPNGHIYACGSPGSGKSSFLLNLLVQRINNGDGCGLLDPHGQLLEKGILPGIPKNRIKDVVLIDPSDTEYPVVFNPLQHDGSKLAKEQIRADLMGFLQLLFEDAFGVNIEHSLNFALLTLLQRKDATILDLEKIVIDKKWRSAFLEGIQDDRIHMFWEMEFPLLEKRGIVTALTNKLSTLTAPDSIIAPMLSSPEGKINFLDIINQRKIFLANLAHGRIGKRNSQLIGKLILSQFSIAAMMRQKDNLYTDFHLFVDELHELLSQSCAYILSATRKYGLHIIGANQSLSDLPSDILRHVLNAAVLIAFNTDYPPDQMILEKSFSRKVKSEDFGSLNRGETYVKMGTAVFNMTTERMPDAPTVTYVDQIIAESRAHYTVHKNPQLPERVTRVKENQKIKTHESQSRESKPDIPVSSPALTPQERSFLECVFTNPTQIVTATYKKLSLSAYMGDKIKKLLISKQFLRHVMIHTGQGPGIAKILLITPQGFDALGHDIVSAEGRGGAVHRYWQAVIKSHAEGLGYSAIIEELIPSSTEKVDLGLHRNGQAIAVEISITTKADQEMNNIVKCLKAGYDRVISLHENEDKVEKVKHLTADALSSEEQKKLRVGSIYEFGVFCL